ncbi:MAG TPA: GNAT family N-acetyltransferase [Nitrososphaerales archaeon]|nr:GNAT family N-acetyltransferase [Nitrososphaerales archaeon]
MEQSFEGLYLRHAKRTLGEIDIVREAELEGNPVGVTMLTSFYGTLGYVFYIAVAESQRRKRIGGLLLDDAIQLFKGMGLNQAFASVEGHNAASVGLFRSRGFSKTSYGQVARRFGKIRAIVLYRRMLVVPGETLLSKSLDQTALA